MGNISFDEVKTELRKFPKGSYIFKKNDFSRDLYVVNTGRVKVCKQVGVRNIVLAELGQGTVFGEISAMDGGPRSATVQAMEETEVYVIPPQEFKKKTESIPDWFMKIVKILVQRLRETDKRIESDNSGSSEYNAVLLLVYLVACEGKDGEGVSKSLDLRKTQDTLMDLLGLQIRTMNEILESLSSKGIIKKDKDKIIVPSMAKLEEYSKTLMSEAAKGIYLD